MSERECDIKVLVAGSPNVGKSTFFNVITGEKVAVANWPGTTVEKKEAKIQYKKKKLCFTDLPGIYNLSSYSLEEEISLRVILEPESKVILVLVDSLDLVKSLYLAVQIIELYSNVLVAVTKTDITHTRGLHIRYEGLQKELGVPVVAISSVTGKGIDDLLESIVEVGGRELEEGKLLIKYSTLEPFIEEMEAFLQKYKSKIPWRLRFVAIKLLEQDRLFAEELKKRIESEDVFLFAEKLIGRYIEKYNRTPREALISYRYEFVESLVNRQVIQSKIEKEESMVDRIFYKPYLGAFLSIAIYFLIFATAFSINIGFPLNYIFRYLGYESLASALESYSLSGILSSLFSYLADFIRSSLDERLPLWLVSLISDGVIPGVGSVLSFLPLIMTVYALLGALEDSGLGVRIALSFNNFFRRFGLTGRSLFPITLAFGCNVPAALSTRSLEDRSERISLLYSIAFIPCQARLVIIMAFVSLFFNSPLLAASAFLSIYMISILVALLTALAIRRLVLKEREVTDIVIEVPPIHKPIGKVVWWHVWDNSKHFLKKAGTIIFALSLIIWLLMNASVNGGFAQSIDESVAMYIGKMLAPIGSLYGLNETSAWMTAFLFENGIIAKEGMIEATMLLNPSASDLNEAVKSLGYTAPQAYAILLAATLYVPCIATIAAIYSESKKLLPVVFLIVYMVAIAIALSFIAYRILLLI